MNKPRSGLRLADVGKTFGATRAVYNANLTVEPGEVLTLLGENGSGKSTLVKMIGGVHRPDTGVIKFEGQILDMSRPRDASALGIETVFQEVLTAASQSVLDNVWLGYDGIFRRRRSRASQRQMATEVLTRLLGKAPLDVPAGVLSLSDRQAICIARALVREPKVLILDESTAALDVQTRDRLFDEIRSLTARGCAVLFISHRMDEVEAISDRVTVLRSGQTVATVARSEMNIEQLIADMSGPGFETEREILDDAARERSLGPVSLRLTEQVNEGSPSRVVEFREGELIGLAGLEGQGQDKFIKSLAGLEYSGGLVERVKGGSWIEVTKRNSRVLGIAYLPRERRGESLFEPMSIAENFSLPTMKLDRSGLIIQARKTASRLATFVTQLSIRFGATSDPISTLSGGNQQKVLLARWLATRPQVLLLNDPTRGVDIKTKRDIYAVLEQLCSQGTTVVMLSSEVEELVELVDRVLVFREQRLSAEIPRKGLTRESVVAAYFGQESRKK